MQQSLAHQLEQAGLSRIASQIESLAEPAIHLAGLAQSDRGEAAALGASRLGGLPDLPQSVGWPAWRGVPMAFVAQVCLEDAAPYDPEKRLPPTGLLSFFYDAKQETYGASPDDRGGWAVYYFPDPSSGWKTRVAPPGLPPAAQFTACRVAFSAELTLPPAPGQSVPGLSWTPDELHHYEAFLSHYPSPEMRAAPHHRLLGYPDQLQDDMQLECALASGGIRSLDDPRAAEAMRTKGEWRLLLQVDSDENAGMEWGSNGLIDFWIRQSDLSNRRFDQAWLVLQSE